MSDNVKLNPGVGGDTIGADDVDGIKYQIVKLAIGSDGSVTRIDGENPLPVLAADMAVIFRNAMITALNRQLASNRADGRLRAVIENAVGGQDRIDTVCGLSSMSAFGTNTVPLREVVIFPMERSNWALNVRSRIT